jgi:hypothetical protein
MGGGNGISPMMGMIAGMMPLVQTKVMEVEPATMEALATLMSESFMRVANNDYSISEFEKWLAESTTDK